jgi:hypothetical protein
MHSESAAAERPAAPRRRRLRLCGRRSFVLCVSLEDEVADALLHCHVGTGGSNAKLLRSPLTEY